MASDLSRFHHRRIADWHSGEMSSYELMELFGAVIRDDAEAKVRTIRLDFAPEDGAVADTLRDGDRPEWKQMLAQVANETAVLRAGQLPAADAEEYGSQLFLPMDRIREIVDEQDELARAADQPDPSDGLFLLWHQSEEVT